MQKKVISALWIVGILLIVASIVIPIVVTSVSQFTAAPDIIGGADAPTFRFFAAQFMEKFSWLALIGVCLVIGSVIGWRKYCK